MKSSALTSTAWWKELEDDDDDADDKRRHHRRFGLFHSMKSKLDPSSFLLPYQSRGGSSDNTLGGNGSTSNINGSNNGNNGNNSNGHGKKHRSLFRVQVPFRMLGYIAAIFLLFPLTIFVWKETQLEKSQLADYNLQHQQREQKNQHQQYLTSNHQDRFPTWMEEGIHDVKKNETTNMDIKIPATEGVIVGGGEVAVTMEKGSTFIAEANEQASVTSQETKEEDENEQDLEEEEDDARDSKDEDDSNDAVDNPQRSVVNEGDQMEHGHFVLSDDSRDTFEEPAPLVDDD